MDQGFGGLKLERVFDINFFFFKRLMHEIFLNFSLKFAYTLKLKSRIRML